jgi:hypothetical protein
MDISSLGSEMLGIGCLGRNKVIGAERKLFSAQFFLFVN